MLSILDIIIFLSESSNIFSAFSLICYTGPISSKYWRACLAVEKIAMHNDDVIYCMKLLIDNGVAFWD